MASALGRQAAAQRTAGILSRESCLANWRKKVQISNKCFTSRSSRSHPHNFPLNQEILLSSKCMKSFWCNLLAIMLICKSLKLGKQNKKKHYVNWDKQRNTKGYQRSPEPGRPWIDFSAKYKNASTLHITGFKLLHERFRKKQPIVKWPNKWLQDEIRGLVMPRRCEK